MMFNSKKKQEKLMAEEFAKKQQKHMTQISLEKQLASVEGKINTSLEKCIQAKTNGDVGMYNLHRSHIKQLNFTKKTIVLSIQKLERDEITEENMKIIKNIPEIKSTFTPEEIYNTFTNLANQFQKDSLMTNLQDDMLNSVIGGDAFDDEIESMINAKMENLNDRTSEDFITKLKNC